MRKKVSVIGLGYIGLPTAAVIAEAGHDVIGVDINAGVVRKVNNGEVHITEPELDKSVKAVVQNKNLKASVDLSPSDVFIICVPTPFLSNKTSPEPNLVHVFDAAKKISKVVHDGNLIILESTCPVGTTELVKNVFEKSGANVENLHFAYCPERVLPGNIMSELVLNDRIIGGLCDEDTELACDFYKTFVSSQLHATDARTAEMCKLTENSFRDVNIAFANELSILCEALDVDIWELISLANKHPRVNILQPGAGVGGHCIAVDPWFLIHASGGQAKLVETARQQNDYKTEWVVAKVIKAVEEFNNVNLRKPLIACMGLAYKENSDDLRESAGVKVYKALEAKGFNVVGVEPNITYHDDFDLKNHNEIDVIADIFILLVKHNDFADLELNGIVLDFCGISQ
jgi:UDP-N-acetyl-D-mannosaminuronic acid dehydrogenase